jgi:hypothetical protein
MFDDILQEEHPEKNGWWINELESLSVESSSISAKARFGVRLMSHNLEM